MWSSGTELPAEYCVPYDLTTLRIEQVSIV